jgi:hypothetical protein
VERVVTFQTHLGKSTADTYDMTGVVSCSGVLLFRAFYCCDRSPAEVVRQNEQQRRAHYEVLILDRTWRRCVIFTAVYIMHTEINMYKIVLNIYTAQKLERKILLKV